MLSGSEAFLLWIYLLPGFVGMLVYESAAEVKKRTFSEKIGLAILITVSSIIISDLVLKIDILPIKVDDKSNLLFDDINDFIRYNLIILTIIACAVGVILAILRNIGFPFKIYNIVRISSRTGKIDAWHQVFTSYNDRWVEVRYDDDTRVIGYVKYYSESGDQKLLFVSNALWCVPEAGDTFRETDVDGPGVFVVNFDRVRAIVFLDGDEDGKETQPKPAKTE